MGYFRLAIKESPSRRLRLFLYVNDSSGAFTPVNGSPYAGASTLAGLAISQTATSSGNYFLYAADQSGSIRAYTVDGNTGALSAIARAPFPVGNVPILLTVVHP